MRDLGGDDPTRLGPYRLRAVIGDGGMGRVYLGTSPGGRAVAVKVIGPGLANQPNYRKRFAREARAAMAVSGLYTASVVDADTAGERPYLATEYVPAPSLADAVKAAGPLPAAAVSALAGGLAEALGAIHRAGLVHRDVKPHNILLAPDGPVVIDFGIALGDDGLTSLTAVGTAIGTPGYIAPEVLGGLAPTAAADLFGLACVLVYAARGVGPFGRGDPLAVAHRTVSQDPDLTGLPDFIRALVMPLLARDPAARPTPAQLLEHLEIVGQDAVLHDGLWLPESVRELLSERRRQVQRLLAGNGDRAGALPRPADARPDAARQGSAPPHQGPAPLAQTPPVKAISAGPSGSPQGSGLPRQGSGIARQGPAPDARGPVLPLSAPSPSYRPPAPYGPPQPATASLRARNALLATGGAVVVAAVAATAVVLAQGKDGGTGGPSGTAGASDGVQVHHSAIGAENTAATSAPASSATETATSTSVSTGASGVLPYRPGTYPVNKKITTDALGLSSVYLVDIQIRADGTVRADLRYTNDTDSAQEFGCTDDTADEGSLAIGDDSVSSTATACTDDPGFDQSVAAHGHVAGYDTFSSAPSGSGPWTFRLSSFEYSGSVSGISIPTQ